ncbi:uncharacterized protein FTOL_09283 [Fusarium torulosum]|uniref:Uncharacterized protein n=1 Tax=Fusarium torulosum TaxID=33205 RepID=A0AAE8MEC5_9HYPO|nr:uncharacterized protein FTOL_09283 [Fusarium torulosum]
MSVASEKYIGTSFGGTKSYLYQCRNTAELLAGPGDFIRSFRCQNDE